MYFPKFAIVGILAVAALAVVPFFFFFRLLLFFMIVRLLAKVVKKKHFRRHYAHHHHFDNRPEPLEAGDMRFFARRFEKQYRYEDTPRYSEKDLV